MALATILSLHDLAAQNPDNSQITKSLKQLSLEQLSAIKIETVTGASRHEQKTTEAPAAISIVTQDDIRKYGHRSLADVLNSVAGYYSTYDRGYSYLGLRGFGGWVIGAAECCSWWTATG